METDPWIPIFIGLGLTVPGMLLAWGIPETMTAAKIPGDVPSDLEDETPEEAGAKGILGHVKDGISRLRKAAIFFIWSNKRISLLLFTVMMCTFGKGAQDMIMQIARRRHSWTWAQVSLPSPMNCAGHRKPKRNVR